MTSLGIPLNVAGVFPTENLGINYFIPYYPLFLMIPFTIEHISAIHNILHKKILKYLDITILCVLYASNLYFCGTCSMEIIVLHVHNFMLF